MDHSTDSVLEVLRALNDSGVQWLLLRNTATMLPDRLTIGKDIDVLVRRTDVSTLIDYLKGMNFKFRSNPLDNNVRWYGVAKPLMSTSPQGVLLDIASEIFVLSTHRSILIPLDKIVQQSAWENSQIENLGGLAIPTLGDEDLFVSLISRCVFDKRKFSSWHKQKLLELLAKLERGSLEEKLKLVFFKFTPHLLALVDKSDFDSILSSYITFKDY